MEAVAGNALYHTAHLAIRATATTTTSASASGSVSAATRPASYKIVGIILAVCSGLFIGVSFVMKKIGLLKANVKYHEEAGEGYGYLKNVWWWGGMTLMIIGEICNFVAYAFTDAILVTPLGALSVVITTILSAIFLKERLSFVGKVGCFLCIVGSVIIPLNAPEQSAVADIQEMQHYAITPGFLTYAGVIILGCVAVAVWVAPRYGKKSMLVYLSICSLIGGLSVVCTQGLGSAILAQINGEPQFNKWFTYVLFVFVIGTLLTEIIYLNKALNLFNAALVTPTYYVYFTSSTIVASAVLFQGFHGTATQIVDVIMGFLVICSGVVLLQLAKSAKDVPDTAVFKGDLDQMRTVAEQEEPEYEPRADTIRGGAGIVRALSKIRTQRQLEEVKRIREERMEPIGENDEIEWDGLRRRKTVSSAGREGSLRRQKTVHPPLGMSQFPDEVSEPDSEVHPGFFGRIARRTMSTMGSQNRRRDNGHSPVPLSEVTPPKPGDSVDGNHTSGHIYGLPTDLQHRDGEDTSYKVAASGPSTITAVGGPGHVQWAGGDGANDRERERASSRGSSLMPPRPPPHVTTASGGAKRQFSFQNVFRHSKQESADRPISRGALSFTSRRSSREYPSGGAATEEERLGLVQGDSSKSTLPRYTEVAEEEPSHGGKSSDEEWQAINSGMSSSPEFVGGSGSGDLGATGRKRWDRDDPYDDEDDDVDVMYDEPLQDPASPPAESRGGSGAGGHNRGGSHASAFV